MKIKFQVLWLLTQIIILIFAIKFLWEFWSSKGDLNFPIGIIGLGGITIFYLPYLKKQIKQLWDFYF